MKKIMLFVMLLLATMPLVAEELTQEEKRFRSQIQSYIRDEGYSPYIDTDETVTFKYEGDTYWVVVEEYKNGFYVTFNMSLGMEDANVRDALIAADETMSELKFLRIYRTSSKKSLMIQVAGYYTSINQFKEMFSSMLYIVSEGEQRLQDKYSEM